MKSQYSCSIEDDDDIKFPLAYIRKMQKIAEVPVLVIKKMALSTKDVVGKKRLDISIKNVWVV